MRKIVTKNVALKRAYERPMPEDGVRILVDRLWPRGVKKTATKIDRWPKEIAPSTELRQWFGHECQSASKIDPRSAFKIDPHLS